MTISDLLCDKVCSGCSRSAFIVISDAKPQAAPVKKDKVLKCGACGLVKASGIAEDEKHNLYHETGADPIGSLPFTYEERFQA